MKAFSMKNIFKLFGITAFVAVIGFSMSACSGGGGDDNDGGGGSSSSVKDGGGSSSSVKGGGNLFSSSGSSDGSSGWTAVDVSSILADGIHLSRIRAIAYGGGKFVAVGEEGKMVTSTDGTNWTAVDVSKIFGTSDRQNFIYANDINAIAYGSGKFVAVGDGSKMAISTDGTNWTAVDVSSIFGSGEYSRIDAIAFGNGKFVAVGYSSSNSKWGISTDGTNWTAINVSSILESYTYFNAISYGSNKFVAVGGNTDKIATSTDGTNWTVVNSSIFGSDEYNEIHGIAFGNSKFIVGGYVGDNTKIAISTDGANWIAVDVSNIFGTSYINAIAYGDGKFVAVGANGKMAASTNGTNWAAVDVSNIFCHTLCSMPSYAVYVDINAIAFGNGKFVVFGENGKMAYSAGN